MRAAVFKSFERYVEVARARKAQDEIDELAQSIRASCTDILADINDENQQSFLQLMITLASLPKMDTIDALLAECVPRLKPLFISNKVDYSRAMFYDFMVNLYDRYPEYRQDANVKGSLIHGLSDNQKAIREKIAQFWDDRNRLDLDPAVRMQQLLDQLYEPEEESVWLVNATFLLLSVSKQSSDFDRKIFTEPLKDCQFAVMHVNQTGQAAHNRSQPMAPLTTQIDLMM